jgi:hypothetical protein
MLSILEELSTSLLALIHVDGPGDVFDLGFQDSKSHA